MLQQRPIAATAPAKGSMGYEEGVLLDGLAAEWHATADGADFAYIKAAVDQYVNADGTITGFNTSTHTLDDIEMGRATLLVYRVMQQEQATRKRRSFSRPDRSAAAHRQRRLLAQAGLSEPDVAGRRLHGGAVPCEYGRPSRPPQDFDDIASNCC